MTPQAWYRYAQRTIDREQGRDKLSRLTQVDVTAFDDEEQQILEVWEDPDAS